MNTPILDKLIAGGVTPYDRFRLKEEVESLTEQSEADAAFRASIDELCKQNGMPERGSSVLHVANNLCKINDRLAMNDIAAVAADWEIPDDMTPAQFLDDRCAVVEDLEEQLAGVQHKLAELEQHGDPWKALDNVRQALSSKIDFYQSSMKSEVAKLRSDLLMRSISNEESLRIRINRFKDSVLSRNESVFLAFVTMATGLAPWIVGLFN